MPMSKRGHCNESLVLKVPLAARGYADGFLCDLPVAHKARLHQTTLRGSTSQATFSGVVDSVYATATIKWAADAPQ